MQQIAKRMNESIKQEMRLLLAMSVIAGKPRGQDNITFLQNSAMMLSEKKRRRM
jgi:hypothetical protein